jgi:hypothetical protein
MSLDRHQPNLQTKNPFALRSGLNFRVSVYFSGTGHEKTMGINLYEAINGRKKDPSQLCTLLNRLSYDPYFFLLYLIGSLNPYLFKNNQKLKKLKNKYNGKRCFVMGNGPSLNEMKIELLEKEYVWGFNRCYLLYDRIAWRPQFYTAVDDLVVPDISEELNNQIRHSSCTTYFFPDNFLYSGVIESHQNIIWFKHRGIDHKKKGDGYFSKNPNQYVRIANTVTITAMQLAVYMGFNPIILIGCDTKFVLPDDIKTSGTVYDSGTGEKITGYKVISCRDNDPNHFDPRYFGAQRKWHAPNVNGMINGYKNTNIVCKQMGIEIINATRGGELEVFPRMNFTDLF